MATRTKTATVARPRDTPAQIIANIADELDTRALDYERARDARCVFARAYMRLSRELAANIDGAGFADPDWVARLARVFVDYYLRALREYDAGTLPRGAWATVFEVGARGRTSVLEDLVLGMTAHIVNDLPFALCDVGLTLPSGQSRIADFHLLNDVLGRSIDPIQQDLTRRYDPLLGLLDRLFEHYDEILTNYGLRISRAAAWYNAERLLDPASREAARAAIARSPEVTQRELLDPPLYSLRCLLRGARVVARSVRRWPSASAPRPARRANGLADPRPTATPAT